MFFWNLFALFVLVEIKLGLGDSVENKYFSVCSRSSPIFSECIKKSIMEARPKFVKGIPEIGFPSLDPMVFKPFNFKEDDQHFEISASFKNVYLQGLSNMTVEDVTVSGDIDTEMTINLTITTPNFHGWGDWSGKGRALQFIVNGGGKIDGNLTDGYFKFSIKGRAEVNEKDNKKYFSVHSVTFDPVMRKARVYVSGLFPGDRYLHKVANKFINRNISFILRIMRNYLGKYIGGDFEKLVKIVFDAWPIDELMLE